ncbi:hypothetical protein F5884DRAFT_287134 [Xylogone sp. PMI_703]|nr:hypothetical protein F5884DRAFT_287134 [Xylogone sp. PMI_703]
MLPPNLLRRDGRIIVHVDYDAFYASVFEAENPALKSVPLAVQQKQIIATCNYKARELGLRKLQLVSEAKKLVPDLVIMLGEELGRFRDASKSLYKFVQGFVWSGKVERLGFDEVFLDITDMVDYNQALLNPNDLQNSFFQLNSNDPTVGFAFDATTVARYSYPQPHNQHPPPVDSSPAIRRQGADDWLTTRLILGSHFARHLRLQIEEQKGYTSSVGISTNKLLSKLVGNVHKPRAQTTLLPPYLETPHEDALISAEPFRDDPIRETKNNGSNVITFLDKHDVGKIPGIGFKMAQRLRNYILSRPPDADTGSIYGGLSETVSVRDVRLFPGMGPEKLEEVLGGPGAERGIGGKVWELIHGIDNTEVKDASNVPSQISIEDSYRSLDSLTQVRKELRILATSLMQRMRIDLLEDYESEPNIGKRWIAHPKTIRLSTRPRASPGAEGTRAYFANSISKSGPVPNFVFNLKASIDTTVEKLVQETLVPMFRKLHPQPTGWNLRVLNIAVTNMVETASEDGSTGGGRDIGNMFRRQEDILREWKVEDKDVPPDSPPKMQENDGSHPRSPDPDSMLSHDSYSLHEEKMDIAGSEDQLQPTQESTAWQEDDDMDIDSEKCALCGATMPSFAMAAHYRFHSLED